jgi:hypothetical protein
MKVSFFVAVASIFSLAVAAPERRASCGNNAKCRQAVAVCATNLGHCDAAVPPGEISGYIACHSTVSSILSNPRY